jgi:hypothetical protein
MKMVKSFEALKAGASGYLFKKYWHASLQKRLDLYEVVRDGANIAENT